MIEDEYLPSLTPSALNLLQPFENDPALAGVKPRLSALRITKVAPSAAVGQQLLRPIRKGQRRLFRAAPLILWRIRYSRCTVPPLTCTVIASLDLEATNFVGCTVVVEEVTFKMGRGKAELVGTTVPVDCKPGDQVTVMCMLRPDSDIHKMRSSEDLNYSLSVRITARALVTDNFNPKVHINFKTNVDFSMALARPTTSGLPPSRDASTTAQRPQNNGPDSLPFPTDGPNTQEAHTTTNTGLTITISGPKSVRVGEIFRWRLFVVNMSNEVQRLALVVIPKRKKNDGRTLVPQRYSISSARGNEVDPVVEGVLDEHILYGIQKNAMTEPTELISLSTDVRIGYVIRSLKAKNV